MSQRDSNSGPVLRVRGLSISFRSREAGLHRAVQGVSFAVFPGQTLAIVGESGCGKSVTAMSLLKLVPSPPCFIEGGEAIFQSGSGEIDLVAASEKRLRSIRGAEITMIFQEPMTSLNPVFTVGDQIIEAVRLHQKVGKARAREVALEALEAVGISEPERRIRQYPHEFSGGMRQRVMIAMALSCRPRLLIADEPTTALDVTIQAQILDLLGGLKQSRSMGLILITHDMGVVFEKADVVCVMYGGRVVEYATVERLFEKPSHPYTRGLLASIPRPDRSRERLSTVREFIENPREFEPLGHEGGSVVPWWPTHKPPSGNSATPMLVEIGPEHWVCVYGDGQMPTREPESGFIRGASVAACS
ncbi:MAG: ABC transporter ATP-binding protein [Phycisphaerales bacterium]|nr:ABC transporter ATP-binding protein [Planctomycetota bacterium]